MTAVWTFFLGLAFALALGAAAQRAGRALGLLDAPSARRVHQRRVPRTGGLALLPAGLAAAGLVGVLEARYVLPALWLFAVGLLDDRGWLGGGAKLLLQLAGAVLAVALGLVLPGAPGPTAPFLTVLWLIAVLEIVNFLDGIDLITCTTGTLLLAAGAGGAAGPGAGVFFAAFAGTAGLAAWNATPARVFPGDAATHLLGFLVAATALAPRDGTTTALPVAWVGVALLPAAVDVAWGFVSKRRLGLAWTAAHREHLYQRLTRRGWGHAAVALRYGALSLALLLLVSRGASTWGRVSAAGIAALLLAFHFGQGLWLMRAPEAPDLRKGTRSGS